MGLERTKIEKRANQFKNKDISTGAKNTSSLIPILLMLPAIIFFFLYMILPLIMITRESLANEGSGLSPIVRLIQDDDWWYSVEYSFIYSILTLSVSLFLSIIVASILSGMVRKRLRGFWQTLFFIPYVTSIVAMSIVFSIMFDYQGGIINNLLNLDIGWLQIIPGEGFATLFTMFIFGVWQTMAFQVLILVTAMLAVDKRLYDAADIDGISKTKQLTNITLPQISKTINYLILVGLITCLKFFSMALFHNDPEEAMTYGPTMLLYIFSHVDGEPELASAAAMMMIVLVILFQVVITYSIKLTTKLITSYNENKTKNTLEQHRRKMAMLEKHSSSQEVGLNE